MNILVAGSAGNLRREVVRTVMIAGHGVRIASRDPRSADVPEALGWAKVDPSTGEGLRQSLMGTDAVVHAASDCRNTAAVDVEGTR